MADEAKAPEALDAPTTSEQSTRLAEATSEATTAEVKPVEGSDVAPTGEAATEGLFSHRHFANPC
jgi:hypothetical protein